MKERADREAKRSGLFPQRATTQEQRAISILRPGQAIKNLLKGGEAAKTAITEIHRRNYHLPAGPLKRALQLGSAALTQGRGHCAPSGWPAPCAKLDPARLVEWSRRVASDQYASDAGLA